VVDKNMEWPPTAEDDEDGDAQSDRKKSIKGIIRPKTGGRTAL